MSAVSRHLSRYTSPRPETIRRLATQDQTTEALRAEVARMNRQKQVDRIKSVLRRAASVWRW